MKYKSYMDGGENGSEVLKDFKGNKNKVFEGSIEMQERIKKKNVGNIFTAVNFYILLCFLNTCYKFVTFVISLSFL